MNRAYTIASLRTRVVLSAGIFAWSLLIPVAGRAQIEVPFLTARVNDYANILEPDTEHRLEARLESVENQHGSQIVVLTIPTLDGEPIEDFAVRVGEAWQIGRSGIDDGVILVVAAHDRRMRLEVGYGLEATIPDAYARRILDNVVTPEFRAGDYDGGVEAGVEAVITLIAGGELPAPTNTGSDDRRGGFVGGGLVVFLAFFSLNVLHIRGPAAWVPYLFMAPFWFFIPLIAFGHPWSWVLLMAWLVGFPILRVLARKSGGGGWISTGSGGWSSSSGWGGGGGFSGGGFSGGGGSFGGGGSSGSW